MSDIPKEAAYMSCDQRVSGRYFFLNNNTTYLLFHAVPLQCDTGNLVTGPLLKVFSNILILNSASAAHDCSRIKLMT
jgi:hypothetical protein